MRKRCSGCGIGIVISRNVDGLNRSDRTFCGRCNSFLKLAHFRCQRWLIPHCRRHPAQQSRDFGTGLRKSKDVVDEEKNVLSLIVAKIFGSGESGKGNAQPCSRRFGHLAINERRLIDDGHALTRLRLFHFQPEIVPLAGALADTSEYGNAAVFGSNIVNEFLNDDGFPTPAPPNRPIFPPFKYGSMRSMTLIPVSNISRFVFWSTSAGAGL